MSLSDERVQEFKEIFKKEYGKEMTDAEAREAGENLVRFVEVLWEMSMSDQKRKHRLKTEPDGFPVDGHYSCIICRRSIDPSTGWYDKNFQKCFPCKRAVDKGIFPSFICHHTESFFSMSDLSYTFELKSPTVRKLVREGKLIARIAHNDQWNSNEYIFLRKENPGLIERHNPVRKSYDRHRAKLTKESGYRLELEMRKEREKTLAKLRKH